MNQEKDAKIKALVTALLGAGFITYPFAWIVGLKLGIIITFCVIAIVGYNWSLSFNTWQISHHKQAFNNLPFNSTLSKIPGGSKDDSNKTS